MKGVVRLMLCLLMFGSLLGCAGTSIEGSRRVDVHFWQPLAQDGLCEVKDACRRFPGRLTIFVLVYHPATGALLGRELDVSGGKTELSLPSDAQVWVSLVSGNVDVISPKGLTLPVSKESAMHGLHFVIK
jgi:hypothetical protein